MIKYVGLPTNHMQIIVIYDYMKISTKKFKKRLVKKLSKKIVALNSAISSGGGKVMLDIAQVARNNDYEYYTFTPEANISSPKGHFYFLSKREHMMNKRIGQMTGFDSAFITRGTRSLIKFFNEKKPDIIHLHGLHNWYIDYKLLTSYLKETKTPTIWTQHDCWSFTGKCPYYTIANCDKWKEGCYNCPQLKEYPQSRLIDNSRFMYKYKKEHFLNIPNLSLVTVSKWLQMELKQSFLKDYNSVVIENGIDTEVFQYKESKLREDYSLNNKFIILGVASGWSQRKGLNDIIRLANIIKNKEMHDIKIVLIGVTDEQKALCEEHNILAFKRTQNVERLVEWYSVADVFLNPSMEETFGLVTVEAMSCGTPVIAYNSTASPEIIEGTNCYCVNPHDLDNVVRCITEVKLNGREHYKNNCIQKVKTHYDKIKQYKKYLDLYETI